MDTADRTEVWWSSCNSNQYTAIDITSLNVPSFGMLHLNLNLRKKNLGSQEIKNMQNIRSNFETPGFVACGMNDTLKHIKQILKSYEINWLLVKSPKV